MRGRFLSVLLHIFSGIEAGSEKEVQKIKVAIIGAGRVGVSLAEELLNNAEDVIDELNIEDLDFEDFNNRIEWINNVN